MQIRLQHRLAVGRPLTIQLGPQRLWIGPPRRRVVGPKEGVELHRERVEEQAGRPDQVGEQHAVAREDFAPESPELGTSRPRRL